MKQRGLRAITLQGALDKSTLQYWKNNKQVILQKRKEYYVKNKDSLREKSKQTFECVCGSVSTISHKSRHEKTKKHKLFIASQV